MFLYGGDYNPEQWKEEKGILDEDLRLMEAAHINTVTLGVFAWSELEPREGEYDFSFFDETIDRLFKSGKKVILATPSGARPPWMAEKYPEVLRMQENGLPVRFGGRHNHCYTSPVYREKVRAIDGQLARRYAKHPAVIAWHISNEFSGECYCPLCCDAFRRFLRNRYGSIGALNRAYWSKFWSHTYDDFSQIDPPGASGENSVPALMLDWRRFVTCQTVDFMKEEIAAVRQAAPHLPVTTNMMPGYYGLDYQKFAEHLDVISWDNYPSWNAPDHLHEAAFSAFWHDFFRSLKGKAYYLMESAPGWVNWKQVNKLQRPGVNRMAALQAVAHGSESVLYFQWRASRGGAEKFHGAIVGHDGTSDTRVFREVSATGSMLEALGEISGSHAADARVAILFDWENMWALEGTRAFMQNKDYRTAVLSCYEALWQQAISCDIVHPHADLSRYSLVIAVWQYMTDKVTEEILTSYVERGGTLFATGFLGMADENDLCHLGGFPGGTLKDVFGFCNEETDALYPEERVAVIWGGKRYEASSYCELLLLKKAQKLGWYDSEFYAGMPCVTVNGYGRGKAYYQAFGDDGRFTKDFLEYLVAECHIASCLPDVHPLPDGVTAHKRIGKDAEYLFVENYSACAQEIDLPEGFVDMESKKSSRRLTVEPFDVRVLKCKMTIWG